jgi:hypothetical protein
MLGPLFVTILERLKCYCALREQTGWCIERMPGNKSTVSCGERSCSEVEDLPLTPLLATVETQLYKIGRRRALSEQQARSLSESKSMSVWPWSL